MPSSRSLKGKFSCRRCQPPKWAGGDISFPNKTKYNAPGCIATSFVSKFSCVIPIGRQESGTAGAVEIFFNIIVISFMIIHMKKFLDSD